MSIDVKVPVLAESIAEATLMSWHKQVGDQVKRGDNLIDIETDKVTLEVAALGDGVLVEILKGDGENVESDEVIARIETGAAAAAESATAEPAAAAVPEQQSLVEEAAAAESMKLSPAVRNLLEENKLNASDIAAGHKDGRLTKEDVLDHLEKSTADATPAAVESAAPTVPEPEPTPAAPTPATPTPAPAPEAAAPITAPTTPGGQRSEQRVPMTRMRRRTAERLLAAQHENALLTTFNEVNMQPVMALRSRYKEQFEKTHQARLGFMSFFSKAAVAALKQFPVINAAVDGDDIVYRDYFDIGIAVSSPRGLVVPIVRDVDLMSYAEIEAKIAEYGQKARDAKLTIEELTGGTFTITNGGIFGSLLSTPIINPPQSAILGMHKIQERPMAENGEVVVRPMMYLALSYDHRIIDGRDAVQFLVAVKAALEDPARLLLQI